MKQEQFSIAEALLFFHDEAADDCENMKFCKKVHLFLFLADIYAPSLLLF